MAMMTMHLFKPCQKSDLCWWCGRSEDDKMHQGDGKLVVDDALVKDLHRRQSEATQRRQATLLRRAILQHRQAIEHHDDLEACDADKALWAAVEASDALSQP